jgi:uncharacterized protein (TIGR00725 family)
MGELSYVGVIGAAQCSEEVAIQAEKLGEGIARLGAVLVCGGRGGVMEAAARGATNKGGVALGILPGEDPRSGNRYLTLAVATGLGDARNAVIARTCDVLVAVDGGYGTLSEIGLALKMGKPVVALGSWRCLDCRGEEAGVIPVSDAEEALVQCRRLLAAAGFKE